MIKLCAGILDLRKGFKVIEDQDTRDTYAEDDEDDGDYENESSEDSAWDEFEVKFDRKLLTASRTNSKTSILPLSIILHLSLLALLSSLARSLKVLALL